MHPFELLYEHSNVNRRRDFRLNDLPRDKLGNLLYKGDLELEYLSYVSWLSDYLSNAAIEPSDFQRDLCNLVASLPKEGAMFLLGSYAAMHEDVLVDRDTMQAIDERFDYSTRIDSFNDDDVQWICNRARDIRDEYEQEMNELTEEEREPKILGVPVLIANPTHEQHVSAENIIQYLHEKVEQQQLCPEGEDYACDIGWRVPLSRVLHNVGDSKERVRLLRLFFAAYGEFALK